MSKDHGNKIERRRKAQEWNSGHWGTSTARVGRDKIFAVVDKTLDELSLNDFGPKTGRGNRRQNLKHRMQKRR